MRDKRTVTDSCKKSVVGGREKGQYMAQLN